MSETKREAPSPKRDVTEPCKGGWNFHVYTLGSGRCSICGNER